MEQGHSIVWNQPHSLRTAIDALDDIGPTLTNAIERVSVALEHVSAGNSSLREISVQVSMEMAAWGRHGFTEQWEGLLGRERAIAGFEEFAQLRITAMSSPEVVINIHKLHCDPLILANGLEKVIHILLEQNLSYDNAQQLQPSLNQLLLIHGHVPAMRTANAGPDFPLIHPDLWSCVVKPFSVPLCINCRDYLLNITKEPCAMDPPCIWLCETGSLAFLPIRAAGIYNTGHIITLEGLIHP
jgi:hypothetical protein